MKQAKEAAREKIIIAAIECTERKGIHTVTVRDIAQQANVNVAAVNYYFGTKEKLLEEMLKFTLYNTLAENIDEIEQVHRDHYSVIKAWFMDFLQGAIRFPNISKAHIYGPLMNNDYKGVFVEWLNDFCSRLADKIIELKRPAVQEQGIKLAVAQMMSAIFLMGTMPDLFDRFLDVDFKDSLEKQEEYVDRLLEHYLGSPGDG